MLWFRAVLAVGVLGGAALLVGGSRWGSTFEERARKLPGDEHLDGDRPARVVMARAVSIGVPPEQVWPWVTQLGRDAGFYGLDWLDNGGKISAWHIVSWIPEPRLGDVTGTGYLRHTEPGKSLAWWPDGGNFLGSSARTVFTFQLDVEAQGTRLISRISTDGSVWEEGRRPALRQSSPGGIFCV